MKTRKTPFVLIVEDDPIMGRMLKALMVELKLDAELYPTLQEGRQAVAGRRFDAVLLDIRLPDGNGLDLIAAIQLGEMPPPVLIMTSSGTEDGAEMAIRSGAWDYIEKSPSFLKNLRLRLLRALEYQQTMAQSVLPRPLVLNNIQGDSPRLRPCLDLLRQAAYGETNVLITGETGTGKELFARAVHDNSRRSVGNFVTVDCATLPDTLVESVLFGYEKGAYTGADRAREGLILQADGGTLFLDEVGELPLEVQKSLLRVLQYRVFRPVGSKREVTSDFRLVTATNRDLEEMVRQGTFREDLYFRLQGIWIELPPLRERPEDIPVLARYYIAETCRGLEIPVKTWVPEFEEALQRYDWPGNVRELVSSVRFAVQAAYPVDTLLPQHLPVRIRVKLARHDVSRSRNGETDPPSPAVGAEWVSYRDFRRNILERYEGDYFRSVMAICETDIQEACRITGLSRSRLYDLLKKHGLTG